MPSAKLFVVDCSTCRAKVAVTETGFAKHGFSDGDGYPYCEAVSIGNCPVCQTILVGRMTQTGFEGLDDVVDTWSDYSRVYPKPGKAFHSSRIPRVLRDSLDEGHRALQANCNKAACVMFGRALEALCRDILGASSSRVMLGRGIERLRAANVIDDKLLQWSKELNVTRNASAHPDTRTVSRQDAEDMQTFVYAIVEYVYDLADRYAEFKDREAKREDG